MRCWFMGISEGRARSALGGKRNEKSWSLLLCIYFSNDKKIIRILNLTTQLYGAFLIREPALDCPILTKY